MYAALCEPDDVYFISAVFEADEDCYCPAFMVFDRFFFA